MKVQQHVTKTLEPQDIAALIDQAVEMRGPDWVYPDQGTCRYVYDPEWYADVSDRNKAAQAMVAYFGDDKAPACLVGEILYTLDPRFMEEMEKHNEDSIEGWMGEDTDFKVEFSDVTYVFTPEDIQMMTVAQGAQDTGSEWGKARDRAVSKAQEEGWL